MKFNIFRFFFAIFMTAIMACSGNDLEQQTMQIHDEAMKNIAVMNRLGRTLKAELSELDSTQTERKNLLIQTIVKIEKADEDMNNWMRNYKIPSGTEAEVKTYLENQFKNIQQNKNDIDAAIQTAEQVIKK